MTSVRLHQQFIRLWQCCHGQPQQIKLEQLAILLGCSRRHMRSLLNAMQQQGWLSWQAAAGRGKYSSLCFHYNGIASQQQQIDELLDQDKIDQLYQQLGQEQCRHVLGTRAGYQVRDHQSVLRLLSPRSLLNLLPGNALQPLERHIIRQVFNGLTRVNPQTGELQPDIAHHWQKVSPLHWRFFLRPAVLFHHGRELDCHDVIHSLQQLMKLPQGTHIQSVSASDDRTLEVQLTQPDNWLPWLLSSDCGLILPKEWRTMADFRHQPVGCGAYQVVRNTAYSLTLKAFNHYFGYRALTDKISIWLSPETPDHIIPPGHDNSGDPPRLVSDYLLFDKRSPTGGNADYRAWLSQILSPVALLYHLPPEQHRIWQVAWSLLPDEQYTPDADSLYHSPAVKPCGLTKLRLGFCSEEPHFQLISQSITRILAQHQVEVISQPMDYVCSYQGSICSDIWLNALELTAPLEFSLFAGLYRTPLLQQCLTSDWQADARRWRSGDLPLSDWCCQRQQQHEILPLFHRQQSLPQGWCDWRLFHCLFSINH